MNGCLIVYLDQAFIERARKEKDVRVERVNVRHPQENYLKDMQAIADLQASGIVKTHIAHVFSLEEMSYQ
ncbi:hypothetical protein [Larkinella terrae]|uniref:Uncharacterized protein n=1 Tax=Larkinella terrae TaxID=2025311 RepID=A0A7K0EFS6_9BACT|nr:hypothetical protein [Larkinella terrae]MRS60288.1 hypothetical protein [Larkinella terrae]